MVSSSKRARRRRLAQRETSHSDHQMDSANLSGPETDREEEDDPEILFPARARKLEELVTPPRRAQEAIDCDIVNMVKTLNGAIAAVSQDTARIQRAYQQLCAENMARDKALADLTAMVRGYGSSPEATRPYGRLPGTNRPHLTIQACVMDGEGNLRAADIGITWEGNETFMHGVMVVGPQFSRPVGQGPIMSTPYPPGDGEDRRDSSTMAQPATPATPDMDGHVHRPSPEVRQGYRPAAPIQRFNNKSLNWPAWFRHFRAVADVHGWNKDQRALQLVSYLDETAMNVAQELGDNDLYNYDVLVKLLSDRFDPASRVSAFRSRSSHGLSRRHHEDADTFAELCRVGYPQSPPELRQELIAEQFVRGQSDPELKKYIWVVIRTQKDRKLQTLIEVCTDFSSLMAPSQIHRPAEQTFAVHQEVESYTEDEGELEDMFAVGDHPPWTNRRSPDPTTSPTLQQMFALARRMGYDMRPIARQPDAQRRPPGGHSFPDQNRGFRPQRTGRDYSSIKCFSCGEFGHMQGRCPRPDSSLPFKPAGWHLQSDNRPQHDGNNNQGNSL